MLNIIIDFNVRHTYEFAAFISLSSVPWVASTNHNPEWKLIFYNTFCISHTWLNVEAWIEAFTRKASMPRRTISIGYASGLFYHRFRN